MHAPATAMLLAAGRGERMRPLTDTCPKPLLQVQGKPLLQWHLEALARGGCTHALINTAWLGEQIAQRFGNDFAPLPTENVRSKLSISERLPSLTKLHLSYSHEGRDFGDALETAGGIVRALPQLSEVFWVLAGDVYVPDFAFSPQALERFAASDMLAHLWLVPNPAHNTKGDFGLAMSADSSVGLALNLPKDSAEPRYTYSTIGLYRKALFGLPWCDTAAGNPTGVKAALAPLLRAAMDQARVSAELYTGPWTDVGTPERLAQLNAS
jgi:MurNAc alpha-1-phosphate uridylyltransferase